MRFLTNVATYASIFLAPTVQGNAAGKSTAFPNPTTGLVTFRITDTDINTLRVIDGFGRVVLTRNWSNGASSRRSADLSDLPNGIYNFELTTNNGEVSVERVIVQ